MKKKPHCDLHAVSRLPSFNSFKAFIVPCRACLWFLRNLGSVTYNFESLKTANQNQSQWRNPRTRLNIINRRRLIATVSRSQRPRDIHRWRGPILSSEETISMLCMAQWRLWRNWRRASGKRHKDHNEVFFSWELAVFARFGNMVLHAAGVKMRDAANETQNIWMNTSNMHQTTFRFPTYLRLLDFTWWYFLRDKKQPTMAFVCTAPSLFPMLICWKDIFLRAKIIPRPFHYQTLFLNTLWGNGAWRSGYIYIYIFALLAYVGSWGL